MNDAVSVGGRYALCVGLFLVLARAQAADFYVSTQGSDSNPGTAAQPFQTITYAYTQAAPGVTIHVMPGVYYDYTSGWGLHLGNSGTASSPIVLRSEVPGGAVIDGQNGSDRNEAIYLDGSYNVVEGFEIRNGPNGGITIWGNGNQILNNEIHHNGNPASTSSNGHDGVYDDQATSGNIYVGNYIHDNGRTGGSNLDHGLYLCGNNEQVLNNVVIRNDSRGLQIAGYTTVSNMKVYNNVFAWNGVDGITVWMDMNGVDIKNNICYQNGRYGVEFYAATGSGVVIDHNLVYGNSGGSFSFTDGGSTAAYRLGTTVSADPTFANDSSSSFDAHLSSSSPAIQAGLNLSSLFNTDIAGAGRPASGAWDLGAYSYGRANTPPTISGVNNQAITTGSSTSLLGFTIGDAQTPAANLTVSASSSDLGLVPAALIVLGGSGANRTVTVTPLLGLIGSATITLTVSDGSLSTSTSFTVTVNALAAPVVALTAPAGGASYSAPATINLAASVAANGHTITQVQFYNGGTLLGAATATPYSFTWTNVSTGSYSLSAKAVYDSGSTVSSASANITVNAALPPLGLTFAADSGTFTAPLVASNHILSQAVLTGVTNGGRAAYTFYLTNAGAYLVSALVTAPSLAENSLYVNIDGEPTDPVMIWDIPVSTNMTLQTVAWRGTTGNGDPTADQYVPKVFTLSAGTHQLVIIGREANTQWGTISITATPPKLAIKAAGRPVSLTLSATGQPGQSYNVQSSPDGRTWSVIGTMTLDATGWCQFTNAPGTNRAKFYRLQGR
ncbi:MAG TPA: Ig-like domain-containing protein [Candidatus Binatia bacterium]|jgi:hypothetical protein|nr:Ig-like domain-containing protein [Candidatus Binatia bacterium]